MYNQHPTIFDQFEDHYNFLDQWSRENQAQLKLLNDRPCLAQQALKSNPKEKILMISCPCPRCTPMC